MEDTTKENVISSIQTIEGAFGMDGILSSALSDGLGEDEQEEDGPEEIELDTGATLAVVTDEEIADDDKEKITCCRKCLIVLAALFILPVINVFGQVFEFTVAKMTPELEMRSRSELLSMETTTSATSLDPYFCEFNPLDPACQKLYEKQWRTEKTTAVSGVFCEPQSEDCHLNQDRRKRSVRLCDALTWTAVCQRVKKKKGRKMKTKEFYYQGDDAGPIRLKSTSHFKLFQSVTSMINNFEKKLVSEFESDSVPSSIRLEKRTKRNRCTTRKKKFAEMTFTLPTHKIKNTRHKTHKSAGTRTVIADSNKLRDHPDLPIGDAASDTKWGVIVKRQRRALDYDNDYETFDEDDEVGEIAETYHTVYALFGIISGILITVFNYRVTTIVGGCVSGLACVITSFITLNQRVMAFVFGALPVVGHGGGLTVHPPPGLTLMGIGNNLVTTSVTVALMEYFRGNRLRVLSVSNASALLGIVVYLLLQWLLFPKIGINAGDWRPLLQYQAATYVICIGGAIALTPLNLHNFMRDAPEESVRSRILDTRGLQMLKSPVIYMLAAIFAFDGLGNGLPKEYIATAVGFSPGASTLDTVLNMIFATCMAFGSLIAALISCCIPRKKLSLIVCLILIAIFGFLMGALTMAVEALYLLGYAIAYSLIYGLFFGK